MKNRWIGWLCMLLLLLWPCLAFGEDFLVTDGAAATPSGAAVSAAGAQGALADALAQLAAGSYLDAFNAFARLRGEADAPRYADYAQARLLLLREDPGAAIALLSGLTGFLDSDRQLAQVKALRLHRFSDGARFGFVDETGAWRIPPQFDWAERVFRTQSATVGTTPVYAVALVFQGQTAVEDGDTVPVSGLYGLVRNDGTLATPLRYERVLWTVDGVAAMADAQGVTLYGIATGEPIGGLYEAVGEYAEGYVPVQQNGLWGYLNPTTGTMLGDGFVWESAQLFCEGMAAVSRDALFGYVDGAGNVAVPLQFSGAMPFGQGLAGVRIQKRWGFIDAAGQVVLKPTYNAVKRFQNGLCAVEKGSAWGMIDTAGQMVLRAKYSEIGDFDPIYHRAWIRQNKLWGLVSTTGAVVLKPAWGTHDEFGGNTLCRVSYRGTYGFVDAGGKTRIQNAYAQAAPFTADFAAVVDGYGRIRYLSKAQRSFTVATEVPVECRNGFIEGRTLSTSQQTVTDAAGVESTVTQSAITYLLYDGEGNPIPVAAYVAGGE